MKSSVLIFIAACAGCSRSAPCIDADPETKVFRSLRTELVTRYKASAKGTDLGAQMREADWIAMLDGMEISHDAVAKNNRDHPDSPQVDVLDLRKEMFGK